VSQIVVCCPYYDIFPFSMSDGKPKSGSPVRLPEANAGPSNRAAEMEQRKSIFKVVYMILISDFSLFILFELFQSCHNKENAV